jgi:hypothetical protein
MGMSVRREQLRMVERRCLYHRPWIGQAGAQEIDKVCLVLKRQAQLIDVGSSVNWLPL